MMLETTASLDVVCLCADWCGTCREYESVIEALREQRPAHRYRWVDIEDEADVLGDIDIETFPTLLVAHAGRVLFAGPVLPRLSDVLRLLDVQADVAARHAWPSELSLGLPTAERSSWLALAQAMQQARGSDQHGREL